MIFIPIIAALFIASVNHSEKRVDYTTKELYNEMKKSQPKELR